MKTWIKLTTLSVLALGIIGGFLALGLVPDREAKAQVPRPTSPHFATLMASNATSIAQSEYHEATKRAEQTECELGLRTCNPTPMFTSEQPPGVAFVDGLFSGPGIVPFTCGDLPRSTSSGSLSGLQDWENFTLWMLDRHTVAGTYAALEGAYLIWVWDTCGGDYSRQVGNTWWFVTTYRKLGYSPLWQFGNAGPRGGQFYPCLYKSHCYLTRR